MRSEVRTFTRKLPETALSTTFRFLKLSSRSVPVQYRQPNGYIKVQGRNERQCNKGVCRSESQNVLDCLRKQAENVSQGCVPLCADVSQS